MTVSGARQAATDCPVLPDRLGDPRAPRCGALGRPTTWPRRLDRSRVGSDRLAPYPSRRAPAEWLPPGCPPHAERPSGGAVSRKAPKIPTPRVSQKTKWPPRRRNARGPGVEGVARHTGDGASHSRALRQSCATVGSWHGFVAQSPENGSFENPHRCNVRATEAAGSLCPSGRGVSCRRPLRRVTTTSLCG